ncbi:MAG: helix-turn-helix transcriptional regulator [Actinobacteria bacterium]|nr:helix-turn-helix transcriptional regulator [Actinomycetota bacterium]
MVQSTVTLASAIGLRVKEGRRSRGWTLDQLAEAAGVSRRMIVNVEQGEANPSITTLLSLSDALGVGLPALVEPPEPWQVRVTRTGEGAVLWRGEHGGRAILVAGSGPPHVVELWDWTLGSGDEHASEAHSRGTTELIQVREGTLELLVAGEPIVLEPGDAASFPGDVAHSYSNPGTRQTRFSLAVLEPDVGTGASRG